MNLRFPAATILAILAAACSGAAQNTWEIRHDGSNRLQRNALVLKDGLVIVGTDGLVLGSDDGIHWSDRSRPAWQEIVASASDSTRMMVLDDKGGVWISSDKGSTWNRQGTFPVPDSVRSLAGQGGLWLAGTSNGTIWRTNDGATWDSVPSGRKVPILSMASNGKTWVAVGGNGDKDAVLLVSDDARTWDTVNWTYRDPFCTKVIHWKGVFVAPTYFRSRWSADGRNWSSCNLTASRGEEMFANDSVLWDGGRLVRSLDSGSPQLDFVGTSNNFVGFRSGMVAYDYFQEILHSTDGKVWSSVHDSTPGNSLTAATNGKQILSNIYGSSDGRTWKATNPWGWNDAILTQIRWLQGAFFLGGQSRKWTRSTNGQDWSRIEEFPRDGRELALDDRRVRDFRMLGDTLVAICPVDPLQSLDSGKTWKYRSSSTLPPYHIPWPGRGTWVSLSTQAIKGTWAHSLSVAVSYDGLHDSTKSNPMEVATKKLDYSLFGNGSLLAASPQRVVFIAQTSPDANSGIGYTDNGTELKTAEVPRLGSVLLNALTWTGSQFVAVGDKGTILVSGDGTRWNRVDSGRTRKNLNALVVADSTLYAFGDSGIILASRLEPSVGIRSQAKWGYSSSWILHGRNLTIRSDAGGALREVSLLDATGRTLAHRNVAGSMEATLALPAGLRGLGVLRIRTDRGESTGRVVVP